jgi:hypothetical protein
MPSYLEWTGDWSRRPPAVITNATLYAFPFKASSAAMQKICTDLITTPSGGSIVATPWHPGSVPPFMLLLCANFPCITSSTAPDSEYGYISERDVGFFIPADLTVNGVHQGIHLINPILWVDNHAGVINGRETFGFPKVLGQLSWHPAQLQFAVDALVFGSYSPYEPATVERVLTVERVVPDWASILLGSSSYGINLSTASDVPTAAAQIVSQALALLGWSSASVGPFDRVRLALLRQFRSHLPPHAPAGAMTQVVQGAEFRITSISAIEILPTLLLLPSSVRLRLEKYDSIDLMTDFGVEVLTPLRVAVRLDCDLELDGTF